MRKQGLAAGLLILMLGALAAPHAGAAEETGSGTLTADLSAQVAGDRFIGVVGTYNGLGGDSLLGIDDVSANLTLTGTVAQNYGVVISEDLAAGVNPWEVTAKVCGPANDPITGAPSLALGADCTLRPNKLVNLTTPTKELPGSAIQLDDRDVDEVLTVGDSGTLTVDGTSAASANPDEVVLSGAQQLFKNAGQATTSYYTEDYVAEGSINIDPAAAPGGTLENISYAGFFVITLIN